LTTTEMGVAVVIKLRFHRRGAGGELYDHDMDPDEMHNLYDDPAYASDTLASVALSGTAGPTSTAFEGVRE